MYEEVNDDQFFSVVNTSPQARSHGAHGIVYDFPPNSPAMRRDREQNKDVVMAFPRARAVHLCQNYPWLRMVRIDDGHVPAVQPAPNVAFAEPETTIKPWEKETKVKGRTKAFDDAAHPDTSVGDMVVAIESALKGGFKLPKGVKRTELGKTDTTLLAKIATDAVAWKKSQDDEE